MEWTPERVQQLKELWSQGFSASEIAEKMGGASRNAIIGKVHRLGLSSRPEPSHHIAKKMPDAIIAAAVLPASLIQPHKPISQQGALLRTAKQCQWPVGDPRQAGFHFCSAHAYESLPYCLDHAKIAYQSGLKKRPSQVQAPDENKPRQRDVLEELTMNV